MKLYKKLSNNTNATITRSYGSFERNIYIEREKNGNNNLATHNFTQVMIRFNFLLLYYFSSI